MPVQLTSEQVWSELEKELFAVVGMVTAKGEPRTVGIMYLVKDRRFYFVTGRDTWKVRHLEANPHISVTATIAKRVAVMPWVKIPAATITFSGAARVLALDEAPPGLVEQILRGSVEDGDRKLGMCLVEVTPRGEFLTYGIGIPLMQMRHPEQARGRAPVDGAPVDGARVAA